MSAFFPFELEPPPWIYRLFSRMGLMQRLYRRMAADLVAAMPTGGLLVDVGAGPGHLLQRVAAGRVRTFVWRCWTGRLPCCALPAKVSEIFPSLVRYCAS